MALEEPTGVLPLRFKNQQKALVSLRLSAQAKQALLEAYAKERPCSMRFAPDGTGPQELLIAGQVFPFQAHKQDQHTEVVRIKGSGPVPAAAEIGTVTHKLHVQPRLDEAQRKRTRERGEEAERDRKERKIMVLGDKSKKSGASAKPDAVRKATPTPSVRPQGKPAPPLRPSRTPPPQPPRRTTPQPPQHTLTPTPPPGRVPTPAPNPPLASSAPSATGNPSANPAPTPPPRSVTPPPQTVNAKKVAAFGRAAKRPATAPGVLKAPDEAVEGARRGGLRLALLGMLCHGSKRRFVQIEQMLSDVAEKVPSLRKPPTREALTAALKEVSRFVAPGFYLLDDVLGQLAREAKELEEAVASRVSQGPVGSGLGSGISSGTSEERVSSVSRTASQEEPGTEQLRSPSPPPQRTPTPAPKPTQTPGKVKARSCPPSSRKAPLPPNADVTIRNTPSPTASPTHSPSRAMHIKAAQGQFREVAPPSPLGASQPPPAGTHQEPRGAGIAPAPGRKLQMQRGGSTPPEGLNGKRRRTVLDDSDDSSDGLGGAPAPLLQQRAASRQLPSPAMRLPPALQGPSVPAHQPVNHRPLSNGVAVLNAGTPPMSSSWEEGASHTTWFSEHLARPEELQPAAITSWEGFEEGKRLYATKLEVFHKLHRLRGKFDRQVRGLTAAKERAIQGGDAAGRDRWEAEAVSLLRSKGDVAKEWARAYWLLHRELGALKGVLQAYWGAVKA